MAISNPRKVLFPQAGYTKLDLAQYYIAVSGGAIRAAGNRPNVLVRYPNGIEGAFFFQKRAPASRPSWIDVVTLQFPSGRTAEEVGPRDGAALVWMANVGDRHAGSLEKLLELSARQAAEGLDDAPWPPHYRKQAGEGPRVTPSRRRTPKYPLVEIGRARKKADALAGLERWKARHADVTAHLRASDVLVDAMRGRFQT